MKNMKLWSVFVHLSLFKLCNKHSPQTAKLTSSTVIFFFLVYFFLIFTSGFFSFLIVDLNNFSALVQQTKFVIHFDEVYFHNALSTYSTLKAD